MEDEEELYLYSWLDPKNAGRKYTEEEVREELGPLANADALVMRLKQEGVIEIPEPDPVPITSVQYQDDDEDWNLYSWLDPENEGRQYTEEEAREELGPIVNADDMIRQLKEQGIVIVPEEEKIENMNKEFEQLKEDIKLSSDEQFYGKQNRKEPEDPSNLTDDERLDMYYDSIVEEGYDQKGVQLIQDMLDNINQLRTLIANDFEGEEGKWADLNRDIQQYAISSIEDLYTFMMESTMPAMEAVKKLTNCLKERKALQNELASAEWKYNDLYSKWEKEDDYDYIKTSGERGRKQPSGDFFEQAPYQRVNNYHKYELGVQSSEAYQEVLRIKKLIEEKTQEAMELLQEVQTYSEMTITFHDTMFSFG